MLAQLLLFAGESLQLAGQRGEECLRGGSCCDEVAGGHRVDAEADGAISKLGAAAAGGLTSSLGSLDLGLQTLDGVAAGSALLRFDAGEFTLEPGVLRARGAASFLEQAARVERSARCGFEQLFAGTQLPQLEGRVAGAPSAEGIDEHLVVAGLFAFIPQARQPRERVLLISGGLHLLI